MLILITSVHISIFMPFVVLYYSLHLCPLLVFFRNTLKCQVLVCCLTIYYSPITNIYKHKLSFCFQLSSMDRKNHCVLLFYQFSSETLPQNLWNAICPCNGQMLPVLSFIKVHAFITRGQGKYTCT